MTNKTREKLKEELNFSFNEGYEQGKLAILRKWKKAIEKLPGGTGFNATYFDIMYEEYLKAKENKI